MIGPKTTKPTKRQEREAYDIVNFRDEGRCQKCHRGTPVTRDHRLNRSQGGLTTAANLQLLCGSGTTGCHGWVTEHLEDALAEGWRVPAWADPLRWPAARYFPSVAGTVRLGWALYDNAGGVTEITDQEARALMEGVT
ncbi:MAG: HNH endonuclease signature motif containing protein [Curtobacterium sp.]